MKIIDILLNIIYNKHVPLVRGGEHLMTSFDLIWILVQELLKNKEDKSQENSKKD